MGSFLSSLWDGLNNVWDFFKAVWKGFGDKSPPEGGAKFDWIVTILASLLGPIGHTYLRVEYYNGSMDHMWLYLPGSFITLGSIPFIGSFIPMGHFIPSSFFTSVLLRGGYLNNASGGKVYDWWMLLPIIVKFVIAGLVLLTELDTNMIIKLITTLLQMIVVSIPIIIRTVNNCNLKSWHDLTSSQWKKIISDTIISYGGAHIFSSSFNIVKKPINMLLGHEIANGITWSLGYSTIYVLLNMYNQTDINTYCTNPNDYNNMEFNNIIDNKNLTIYNIFLIVSLISILYNLWKYSKYINIINANKEVSNSDPEQNDSDSEEIIDPGSGESDDATKSV